MSNSINIAYLCKSRLIMIHRTSVLDILFILFEEFVYKNYTHATNLSCYEIND